MRDDINFNGGMRDKLMTWRKRDLFILTGKMRESFENDCKRRVKNRKSHVRSS